MSANDNDSKPNPIRRSYIVAGIILLLLTAYIGSGVFSGSATATKPANKDSKVAAIDGSSEKKADDKTAAPVPTVRVKTIAAETRNQDLAIRGQTEALRKVQLRAETAGQVVRIHKDRGASVKTGDIICELKVDERQAMLKQASAVMRQRELEYEASKKLLEKGFRSETALAGDQAEFEAAKAQVERMEKELEHTKIRAPFAGIVDARSADVGDYLSPGQPCALVIDQDPFLVVGQVSEKDIGQVAIGDKGYANLITGERVEGNVRFVSKSADSATRTFRVELEVKNPDGKIRDGVTAEMHITGDEVQAHVISPAILSLDEKGQIGVRIVDEKKRVRFVLVNIVAESDKGIWVSGLPKSALVIIVGQDFVTIGQEVNAVPEVKGTPS